MPFFSWLKSIPWKFRRSSAENSCPIVTVAETHSQISSTFQLQHQNTFSWIRKPSISLCNVCVSTCTFIDTVHSMWEEPQGTSQWLGDNASPHNSALAEATGTRYPREGPAERNAQPVVRVRFMKGRGTGWGGGTQSARWVSSRGLLRFRWDATSTVNQCLRNGFHDYQEFWNGINIKYFHVCDPLSQVTQLAWSNDQSTLDPHRHRDTDTHYANVYYHYQL